jgi:hypothetical protein
MDGLPCNGKGACFYKVFGEYFLFGVAFSNFLLSKSGMEGEFGVSVAQQQNLVLPFLADFVEITRNREAVINGLLAIQRFFEGNIWSPLGANIYSVFHSGVVGATGHLSDAQVLNIFPAFEPERWQEKAFLW